MRSDFGRAAASYDEAAVLAKEVGLRMTAKLDFIKLAPARAADIGCATGDGIRLFAGALPAGPPPGGRLRTGHAGRSVAPRSLAGSAAPSRAALSGR
jgi:malonyl-CoA O-methyltransferase